MTDLPTKQLSKGRGKKGRQDLVDLSKTGHYVNEEVTLQKIAEKHSLSNLNAELAKSNFTLRIKRIGSGKDTFYQPAVIKR